MRFEHPEVFLLLPVAAVFLYFLRRKRPVSLKTPFFFLFPKTFSDLKSKFAKLLEIFGFVLIFLLIIGASGPELKKVRREVVVAGIDIMVVLDISSSMSSHDFGEKSRLEVAKEVVRKFVESRLSDRIGIIAFAASPFLLSPLTLDKEFLLTVLKEVKIGDIPDGTAIGLALANAVVRLEKSPSSSKVIILLTDGMNNRGEISPYDAAEMAKKVGIRVYTIGVGRKGKAKVPIQLPFGETYIEKEVEIDEVMLRRIAGLTGGVYFRAIDPDSLRKIFREIDSLEKSFIKVKVFEEFRPLRKELTLVLYMLGLIWFGLRYILFRREPL